MTRQWSWTVAAVAAALLATPVHAQQAAQGTISGTITDAANGQPLPGAQVGIVGTVRGTVAGDNGQYRLAGVPAGSYQVRVLRIGYQSVTRPVTVAAGASAELSVALAATVVNLDQVVITATGEQIRQRETGNAIARIVPNTEQLAASSNVTDVLNSRTPGIYVQQSSGASGTGSRIRIRGANSLSLTNEPLLIVDGVRALNDVGNRTVVGGGVGTNVGTGGQVVSRLNDINPEDIESIEVIKGPAGVAIYGTAAANGVIQVTTKRGRAGKTAYNVYGEYGSLEQPDVFPANYGNLGTILTGATAGARAQCTNEAAARGVCRQGELRSLNPLSDISPFRIGHRQSYGATASGGLERLSYFVGLDLQQENGVQTTSNDKKTGLRANFRAALRPNWDLNVSTGYTRDNLELPVNDNSTLGLLPVGLLGRPLAVDSLSGGFFNNFTPTDLENLSTQQETDRFITSLTSSLQATSWLSFTGVAGLDYVDQVTRQAIQPNRVFFSDLPQGSANSNPLSTYTWTAQGTGTATFDLAEGLRSTTQLGAQYTRELFRGTNAFGAILVPGSGSLSGTSARFAVSEFNTDNILLGLFSQEQLAWRDRVFLSGGVRGDRNSAFGQNFGFTYYPFVNASWVLSDEGFFPQNPIVSSVRLRAAAGRSGQRPRFRDAITYYNPVAVRANDAEQGAISFANGGVGDPNLKPETTTEQEYGFDAGFGRGLNFLFTYFTKTTKDLLVQEPLPLSLGAVTNRFVNLGELRNRGVEMQLNGSLVNTRPVAVDLTAGVNFLNNKLLSLGADSAPIIINTQQQHRQRYPAGGFWQRPYTYADANGDGLIARTEVTLGDTAVYLGNPLPKREWQLQPGVTLFEVFRVSALFSRRSGYRVNNQTNRFRCAFAQNCQDVNDPSTPLDLQARAAAALLGTDAGYIEDGAFTRLRELAFTLTAPKTLAQRLRTGALSLTVTGRNLKTWSDYTGLDPEVTSTPGSNFGTSEFLTVPPTRYWTARVNVNF